MPDWRAATDLFHSDGNSPLKLFTHAKTTITDIFKNIGSYVSESNKFLNGSYAFEFIRVARKYGLFIRLDVSKPDRDLISSDNHKDIQQLKDKVNRILTIISRDHMKVVFFGR